MKSEYRSDLSKAKNLGAAGSGSNHWWHQRLTAIIISLMILWVISFFGDISKSNITTAISHLRKPFNIKYLMALSLTSFPELLKTIMCLSELCHLQRVDDARRPDPGCVSVR